jgi:hypothetical protein
MIVCRMDEPLLRYNKMRLDVCGGMFDACHPGCPSAAGVAGMAMTFVS